MKRWEVIETDGTELDLSNYDKEAVRAKADRIDALKGEKIWFPLFNTWESTFITLDEQFGDVDFLDGKRMFLFAVSGIKGLYNISLTNDPSDYIIEEIVDGEMVCEGSRDECPEVWARVDGAGGIEIDFDVDYNYFLDNVPDEWMEKAEQAEREQEYQTWETFKFRVDPEKDMIDELKRFIAEFKAHFGYWCKDKNE